MKESIQTAVRMVGHLLEHNGITGPFVADRRGLEVPPDDPQACLFCLAGAVEVVAKRLGLSDYFWGDRVVTPAIRTALGVDWAASRVITWEGTSENPTTPAERLAIARRLQTYEES